MRSAILSPYSGSNTVIDSFGGLDRRKSASASQMYDLYNLVCSDFPALKTRPGKLTDFHITDRPTAMLYANERLVYTAGNSLYVDRVEQCSTLISGEKDLILFGTKVCVFPDGYYADLATLGANGTASDKGYFSNERTNSGVTAVFLPACPESFGKTVISDEEPEEPVETYWLDTSQSPCVLKYRKALEDDWIELETGYTELRCPGVGTGFHKGDGVNIKTEYGEIDTTAVLERVSANRLLARFSTDTVSEFPGSEENVTVTRRTPVLDCAAVYKNRIFGCRYGINENGEFVNEIYASKLGDPFNWEVFSGRTDDSYSASCGSFGPFTGMAVQMGYLLFFKSDRVYRLLGDKPSNFTLSEHLCEGVGQAFKHSLCLSGDTLYYLNPRGLFAYGGASPVKLSAPLGEKTYVSGRCEAFNGRVYCNICDGSKYETYVYDTKRKLFERYDDVEVCCFACGKDHIAAFEVYGRAFYFSRTDAPGPSSELIGWHIITHEYGKRSFGGKYVSGITLRLKLDVGSYAEVYASYDGSDEWELLDTAEVEYGDVFEVSCSIPRHDSVRFWIIGSGNAVIEEVAFRTEYAGGRGKECSST